MNWVTALSIVFCIAGPLFIVFVWAFWLERWHPYPEKVRRFLLLAVLLLTLLETWFIWSRRLRAWMWLPILLVNGWGYLDAVLRFPVVHDIESLFTVKNLLLLAFKVAMLAFGFRRLDRVTSACCMLGLVIMNLLGMPALYLIALPMDDTLLEQRIAAHDVNDVDLAQSLFRFMTSSKQRQESMSHVKKQLRMSLQMILKTPLMAKVEEAMSPTYRKPISALHKRAV